jgi:hypothetical protein
MDDFLRGFSFCGQGWLMSNLGKKLIKFFWWIISFSRGVYNSFQGDCKFSEGSATFSRNKKLL